MVLDRLFRINVIKVQEERTGKYRSSFSGDAKEIIRYVISYKPLLGKEKELIFNAEGPLINWLRKNPYNRLEAVGEMKPSKLGQLEKKVNER
ncbi:hypothetical protein ACFL96_07930 [Thermoproteota archaeon]